MPNDSRAYIAVFVSKSSVGSLDTNLYYQECFTLIKATSPSEARQKAVNHVNNTVNTSYANERGETVTWVVEGIIDVTNTLDNEFELHTDVVELYVRGFENYKAYQDLFGLSES